MLFALYKKDGQSQKDLAKQLNINPATITVMLTRMEKAGLLERRKDPDDQRVVNYLYCGFLLNECILLAIAIILQTCE